MLQPVQLTVMRFSSTMVTRIGAAMTKNIIPTLGLMIAGADRVILASPAKL